MSKQQGEEIIPLAAQTISTYALWARLGQVIDALRGIQPGTADFTEVVSELRNIVDAVQAIPSPTPTDISTINSRLDSIINILPSLAPNGGAIVLTDYLGEDSFNGGVITTNFTIECTKSAIARLASHGYIYAKTNDLSVKFNSRPWFTIPQGLSWSFPENGSFQVDKIELKPATTGDTCIFYVWMC